MVRKAKKKVAGSPASPRKKIIPRRVRADEMLANALRLFAELGYANTTVKIIADAAAVNPALLYYYHENKESLFIASLQYAINSAIESHESLDMVERTADPAAVLRYYFEKNRRLLKPLSHMMKLMAEYRTSARRIPAVDALITRFYEAEISLLTRALRRGVRIGQFRRVDIERTAQFVSTYLDGLTMTAMVRPDVEVTQIMNYLELILFEHLAVKDKNAGVSALDAKLAAMP